MENLDLRLAQQQKLLGGERTSGLVQVSIREWAFVLITSLLILGITGLPYVYGYLSAPSDKQFMGIMLDVPDHAQYFSWMRELTHAHLAANKMTPENNPPLFFNLLWWLMGRTGNLLGWGFAQMFQVLRILSATLFLWLTYYVCAMFFEDSLRRKTAFLVVALTSGFGWVLVLLKYTLTQGELLFPLDLYVAEGNTFLGILGYPHFIAAALYIYVFVLILQGQKTGKLRYAVAGGLVALFLGWQHAYDLWLIYGILFAYVILLFLRDRRIPIYIVASGIIVGLISWWPALYSVLLTALDPTWKQVLTQFANAGVYTPGPLHLPILLGPAFLLAIYTLIRENPVKLAALSNERLFLQAWFLAFFLLVYLPVDYQIHMLNGWQVPIALLATIGLFKYVYPFVQRLVARFNLNKEILQRGLAAGLILIILPTNLYLLLWRFIDLSRHDYPYYLYNDEIAAMEWLDENALAQDVVLSSLAVGQYIPAYSGKHAFLAHWAQTLDYFQKEAMVEAFYTGDTTEAVRLNILERYRVEYVFWGPAERSVGDFDPTQASFLEPVFTSELVKIFRVQR